MVAGDEVQLIEEAIERAIVSVQNPCPHETIDQRGQHPWHDGDGAQHGTAAELLVEDHRGGQADYELQGQHHQDNQDGPPDTRPELARSQRLDVVAQADEVGATLQPLHPWVGVGQAQEKRGNRGVIDEEHEEQTDRQDSQVGSPLLASNPPQAYCLYCAFSSFQRFATASTAASGVSWPWAALRIASVTLCVHGPHHLTVRGSWCTYFACSTMVSKP